MLGGGFGVGLKKSYLETLSRSNVSRGAGGGSKGGVLERPRIGASRFIGGLRGCSRRLAGLKESRRWEPARNKSQRRGR